MIHLTAIYECRIFIIRYKNNEKKKKKRRRNKKKKTRIYQGTYIKHIIPPHSPREYRTKTIEG